MKSEKRPIEVEDLLRLKRAERPPVEFWPRFDRELRAKQLSALVAKRPWWQRLPRAFGSLRPYHLPLGAAAVLTITFLTLRDTKETSTAASVAASAARETVAVFAPLPSVLEPAGRESAAPRMVAAIERPAPLAAVPLDIVAISDNAATVEITAASEPARNSLLASASSEFASHEAVSRLRHTGASLTSASAAEPVAARGLLAVASSGFEARALPPRAAVEPLQQITPPSERSRMKLLTAMVSMSASDSASRTGERAADRISEERLYDQVSRFGARGAGVSMKF